jgi:hypothetical protein
MPSHKFISLRDSLKGAVGDFLDDERMACIKTQDGLVEIINALSYYREEGHALFPEIFVIDNLEAVFKVLPTSEYIHINDGPKDVSTMIKALKQCAPLAQGGWVIYVLRKRDSFEYGVFRSGTTILSVSIEDILINNGDPAVPVIMVHQIADKIIEMKGFLKSCLSVNFGVDKEGKGSPVEILEGFVSIIISSVPAEVKELAQTFYRRLLSRILKEGHGTLAAVISNKKRKLPKEVRDGVILNPPINVVQRIEDLIKNKNPQANIRLNACIALIPGMMRSDGITIFATDGSVRAYNVFINHPTRAREQRRIGGARSRTFEALCGMLGNELMGAFVQSQDGRLEYKGVTR